MLIKVQLAPQAVGLAVRPWLAKPYLLLQADQICTIAQEGKNAIISMSNGETLTIISPPYEEWENDVLKT